MFHLRKIAFGVIASALCSSGAVWAVPYDVTDLGTLPGGDFSVAYGINNDGHVVGASGSNQPVFFENGFLYTGSGPMQDMSPLIGAFGSIYGINDSGQFVGVTGNGRAYLCSGGATMQDLGVLPGGTMSDARAINSSGHVVGMVQFCDPDEFLIFFRAFLYSGSGPMQDLGTLGGSWSQAHDINKNGLIVGQAETADGEARAFLCSGSDPMRDLGTLPRGSSSGATGINDSGQIVGLAAVDNDASHAFLYSGDGPMRDLGTLGGSDSRALAISNCGQVVGEAYTASGDAHAFLYSDNTMTDLNSLIDSASRWTLWTACDINDVGQIVGYGSKSGGAMRAFLLTPTPEPSISAFLATGVAGLLFMAWRQRKRSP